MTIDASVTSKPILAIVLPCYNEDEALKTTIPTLLATLQSIGEKGLISPYSYIVCVDDGSNDATWPTLVAFHHDNKSVKAISLAHNRGQQNALIAGLMAVDGLCDMAVTIDADLQDSPDKIEDMVLLYAQGKEIVYGVRSQRSTDSWIKRVTARKFYRLQQAMGLETIYDHADFRLMSARAIAMLAEYGETNLFLRGIIPLLGLETATIHYNRRQRVGGKPKYDLTKMINLSLDGITSFTSRPIRFIFVLGLILLLSDIAVAVYVFSAYFREATISGWTSIMLSIWFLGSLLLMSIGIVGEYVGKIYNEVKHRPRYSIKETLW